MENHFSFQFFNNSEGYLGDGERGRREKLGERRRRGEGDRRRPPRGDGERRLKI